MKEDVKEFNPGTLGALTYEQREVLDLLSRGVMRYEIARRRQARTEEIFDVVDSVNEMLQTQDSAAATYRLLKEGLLVPDEDEAAAAREKLILLTDDQKNVLKVIMSGRRYEEAGQLLGISGDEVRAMMDDITSVIHSRSPEQTVRLAYVSGLGAEDAQTEPEAPEPEAPIVSKANIEQFLSWMFPKQTLDLEGLDDAQLAELAEAIKARVREYVAGMPSPKHKRQVKPALGYIDQWLEGQTIPGIALRAGKHDGSVRLSLMGFAERVGQKTSPDGLLNNE